MPCATAPFDRPDADVVILSSDNVKFLCHKPILSIVSPFFSDMFSLPQPVAAEKANIPTVPVTEDCRIVDALLRLIYPVLPPLLTEPTFVVDVLSAGKKYQVSDTVLSPARSAFTYITHSHPFHAFAASCGSNMEACAAEAARFLLGSNQSSIFKTASVFSSMSVQWKKKILDGEDIPDVKSFTAGAYFRLLWYLSRGGTVGKDFLFTVHNVKVDDEVGVPPVLPPPISSTQPAGWFTQCDLFDRVPADLSVQSAVEPWANIPAHSFIISLASQALHSQIGSTTLPSADGQRVLQLPERACVLHELIRFCYGASTSSVDTAEQHAILDLSLLREVASAADKYKMPKVTNALKRTLRSNMAAAPIEAYFVAISCGWKDEALEAAKCASTSKLREVYVSQMEWCSAQSYHDLLRFWARYNRAIAEALATYSTLPPDAPRGSSDRDARVRDRVNEILAVSERASKTSLSDVTLQKRRTLSFTLVHRYIEQITKISDPKLEHSSNPTNSQAGSPIVAAEVMYADNTELEEVLSAALDQ
ncbi:hypothetical protein EIP91_004353 [Steccherinum ochraceum]|uniref:BTB domain-containing protein n=1 Tax=Steccherinum ochraceum TaxID=92696 RepID=A0A4R0RKA0_9APHY|nr:hypothetical protein EIP91_004353 [Steccherinum ochraceum]